MKSIWLLIVSLCLLTQPVARAMTAVPRSLDQLVARADLIFRGVAISRKVTWKGEGAARHIVTRVTFQVGETFKGASQKEQTLEFFGGERDGFGMGVADMPTFLVNDDAIFFVEGNERQLCPLVGADQGAFRITKTPAGDRVLSENGDGLGDVDTIGKLRRAVNVRQALTAESFRGEILQRVERQNRGLLRVED